MIFSSCVSDFNPVFDKCPSIVVCKGANVAWCAVFSPTKASIPGTTFRLIKALLVRLPNKLTQRGHLRTEKKII